MDPQDTADLVQGLMREIAPTGWDVTVTQDSQEPVMLALVVRRDLCSCRLRMPRFRFEQSRLEATKLCGDYLSSAMNLIRHEQGFCAGAAQALRRSMDENRRDYLARLAQEAAAEMRLGDCFEQGSENARNMHMERFDAAWKAKADKGEL